MRIVQVAGLSVDRQAGILYVRIFSSCAVNRQGAKSKFLTALSPPLSVRRLAGCPCLSSSYVDADRQSFASKPLHPSFPLPPSARSLTHSLTYSVSEAGRPSLWPRQLCSSSDQPACILHTEECTRTRPSHYVCLSCMHANRPTDRPTGRKLFPLTA